SDQKEDYKIVYDRKRKNKRFKTEEYWLIGDQIFKDKKSFTGKFYGVDDKKKELKNQEDVDKILEKIKNKEFNIDRVNRRERKRNPAKPFITSSLQQDAARSINFKA